MADMQEEMQPEMPGTYPGDDNSAEDVGNVAQNVDVNEYDILETSDANKEREMERDSAQQNSKTVTEISTNVTSENDGANVSNVSNISNKGENMTKTELQNCESKEEDENENHIEMLCPKVNCPEKIVICLDMSSEMDKVTFRSRSGDKFAPLKLIKRALGIFVQTKNKINPKHEFAVVVLHNTAKWVLDFTNDPKGVLCILDDLVETVETEIFDMSSLFDSIANRIPLPSVADPTVIPPPYIIRTLFIYGRSQCVFSGNNSESQKLLQASPHFFLDSFYIHLPPSEENKCQAIFDAICDLDEQQFYYVFEVQKNPTKLYDGMAQLLAHPLQRPLQRDASYKLRDNREREGVP